MPKDKYFLFFGRLSYEKGVKTLLTAFKNLPQCRLKIVGTGPKEGELKAFAEAGGMNNVEFFGYKQGQELADIVSNAYFVIVPSEWYENNPMTIIEAYSAGTPVIGARIGGIPEIVVDGKTGFQFESGDEEDLRRKVMVADSIGGVKYTEFSMNTIRFANDHLSKESYWNKLIAFYRRFVNVE